jgi:hypothetical protein
MGCSFWTAIDVMSYDTPVFVYFLSLSEKSVGFYSLFGGNE